MTPSLILRSAQARVAKDGQKLQARQLMVRDARNSALLTMRDGEYGSFTHNLDGRISIAKQIFADTHRAVAIDPKYGTLPPIRRRNSDTRLADDQLDEKKTATA